MILNALWAGSYAHVTAPPAYCEQLARLTGLPLIFLHSNKFAPKRGHACHEETELGLELSLGDVLSHELGLEVPGGAIILLIDQTAGPDPAAPVPLQSFSLLAETLEAGIRNEFIRQPVSLQVWAYLSLTDPVVQGDRRLTALRDMALEQIWGYPSGRAIISFETFLALLEPGFALPPPEPALAGKLESCASVAEWLERLQRAFEHSSQCDLARS
ncbi:hypothetical protein [Pseudogemmobacter faecipullorum]|uniref:Uncharacterized protein n=1 Tax=Pseudogemmobacter faecipullorum TaxID=2755041 RepID=A0ABS8CNA3_9RHOB|nr:hypothetical protein [Pseudogemmobacter faecipullorum]MCB5410869.1 hypothetical protein [Pseudogemmobacter faecipullorum]